MSFIKQFGALMLASRMRVIIDLMSQDVSRMYHDEDLAFEPRWYVFIALLMQHPALSICEMADQLGCSHAAINQLAKELSKNGFVASAQCRSDKRRRRLTLTDKGRGMYYELQPLVNDIAAAAEGLLEATGTDVLGTLDRLEAELRTRSLYDRYTARKKARQQQAVTLLTADQFDATHLQQFQTLNETWLKHLYSLEAVDRHRLADPIATMVTPDPLGDGCGSQIWLAMVAPDDHQPASEVVGTLAMVPHCCDGMPVYEITYFVVKTGYRNQQIGSTLLRNALQEAHARSPEANVVVSLTPQLTAAQQMLRPYGFSPVPPDSPLMALSPYERFNRMMALKSEGSYAYAHAHAQPVAKPATKS
ncbi:MAG: GNAT family N-acetyltransferase, partial [Cyanobacteria bacterium HKST-UBA05]|nr:GNAT family N-acetyltransferase [Cyanobacteria bacterium HKST-UBA05]